MAESQPKIAVIGGGCAGLAAATRLAQNNILLTLFEASPHLGGRARGVQWKGLGLDNGQHILLGAYSETLQLLKLAGVDQNRGFMRLPLRLDMHDELTLAAPAWLPAPLHIIAAFTLAKGLSLQERLAAIRFMVWMKLAGFTLPEDETLQELLQRKRQPERVTRLIWEPLCLAALNTPLNEASAQVFLNVLRDSFAKARADSDMLLPRYDLSSLMAEPLAAYIRHKGGDIRLDAAVARLEKSAEGFTVETAGGIREQFSHVILATSPFRLQPLISGLADVAEIAGLAQFSYQPIYTVYLQYPETVKLSTPMLGLAKGPDVALHGQWVFDRGQLCSQPGLLSVVISAEGLHQRLTQQELAQAVADELSAIFPGLPAPLWHKVIGEKRATFACKTGMQRPLQQTSMPGLYLAGDYTSDGIIANLYPATIEGAVRSGLQCAEHILRDINQ